LVAQNFAPFAKLCGFCILLSLGKAPELQFFRKLLHFPFAQDG